ncbi:MAG: hypothetical protein EU530_08615 [Promethearchaeota archaeon]|nr:MAG: hypothetical protein EU530_08615 [Candidatus Lokiarchaeota archaeon]
MEKQSLASMLKGENIKLKTKLDELESTLTRIAGSVHIYSAGTSESKIDLYSEIVEVINSARDDIKVVTPKIGPDFANILIEKAKKGNVKIQVVINDRRILVEESKLAKIHKKTDVNYEKIYDLLKVTPEVDLINNPNVKFLMVWTRKNVIFAGGWLEKSLLEKTILLGVHVKDVAKIEELSEIYKQLLPTFMR